MEYNVNTGNLTQSEREVLHKPSDMAELSGQCVGKANSPVFFSMVQTLDKFTAANCVGRFGLTARCFVSGRQPEGQAAVVNSPYKPGLTT